MKKMTASRINRRTFLATSAVAGATVVMPAPLSARTAGEKTSTILHANDLHSNLIGMAPAADYTPLTLNDDYFPRASGLRFTFDPSRPQSDLVTEVAVGDLDRGYRAIDITGADSQIYGVTCPLFFALMVVAIPKFTDGRLALVAKNRHGQPLQTRVEAIAAPAGVTPDLLPESGISVDVADMVELSPDGAPVEIKEWQAIMEYLQSLPAAVAGELPIVPTDPRANEPRFTRLG